MKGKLLFVAGLATGYVLGARAGRTRYEQIARAARKFWSSEQVQESTDKATAFVNDKAPELVDFIADTVKKMAAKKKSAGEKLSNRSKSAKSDGSGRAGGDRATGITTDVGAMTDDAVSGTGGAGGNAGGSGAGGEATQSGSSSEAPTS